MASPDPDSISFVRVVLASVTVFGLIALMGLALKYVQRRGFVSGAVRGQRLRVVESIAVDARRRLVIVRCDDAEHLLLLGSNKDLVVEANLQKNPADSIETKNRTRRAG